MTQKRKKIEAQSLRFSLTVYWSHLRMLIPPASWVISWKIQLNSDPLNRQQFWWKFFLFLLYLSFFSSHLKFPSGKRKEWKQKKRRLRHFYLFFIYIYEVENLIYGNLRLRLVNKSSKIIVNSALPHYLRIFSMWSRCSFSGVSFGNRFYSKP